MSVPVEFARWGAWEPLRGAGRNGAIAATAGLYRIRRIGQDVIDYIGQTGNSLRGRLGMLNGVYRLEMPYNDPHTAGPGFWALRHRDGCDFEASVVPIEGDRRRLGLECLAISLYRVETGHSPTLNFGGMPPGYRKSTSNNARLVAAGNRRRGGPDPTQPDSDPSRAPLGPLGGNPTADDWMALGWSAWVPTRTVVATSPVGVYRVRRTGEQGRLLYVGQGRTGKRLAAHLAKGAALEHRQSEFFAADTEASIVALPDLSVRSLLEIENDLIAAHVLTTREVPDAQFLG